MTRSEGPEEFFEALRSARKTPSHTGEKIIKVGPRKSEAAPDAPATGADSATAVTETPANPSAPDSPSARPVQQGFKKSGASSPSAATDSEPVISMRISTLIFAIVLGLVLIFIAYAVGRRIAFNSNKKPAASVQVNRSGVEETRTPTLPDELRGKYGLFVRDFNPRESASLANARAYQAFLNSDPQSEFIRSAGKKAFILSVTTRDFRRLSVCVGPFDGINTPQINDVLAKLKEVKYNGVRQFNQAEAMPFPVFSKVLTDEPRRSQ